MAAGQALGDSVHSAVQTAQQYGFIRKVYINATIGATGAVTLVSAGTDPGIAIALTSEGLYSVTGLPTATAKRVLACGGSIINNDTSPTVDSGRHVSWGPFSLSAGTGSIIVVACDDGDVSHPTSGTTLSAWFELSCGT